MDLVTYKQAEMLKTLGFNMPCLYHYDKNDNYPETPIPNGCDYDSQDVSSAETTYNTNSIWPNYIDCPFQQQVVEWSTNQYNVTISVRPTIKAMYTDDVNPPKYEVLFIAYVYRSYCGDTLEIISTTKCTNTYNEALSEAIEHVIHYLDETIH